MDVRVRVDVLDEAVVGLGAAEDVVEAGARAGGERVPQPLFGDGLPGEDDRTDRRVAGPVRGQQPVEEGHALDQGHLVGEGQFPQIAGVPAGPGVGQHDRAAGLQDRPDVQERQVEVERREAQGPGGAVQPELPGGPVGEPVEGLGPDRDELGDAGGPGGGEGQQRLGGVGDDEAVRQGGVGLLPRQDHAPAGDRGGRQRAVGLGGERGQGGGAQTRGGDQGVDPLAPGRQQQGDGLRRLVGRYAQGADESEAGAVQVRGGEAGQPLQLRVGDPFAGGDERGAVGLFLHMSAECL